MFSGLQNKNPTKIQILENTLNVTSWGSKFFTITYYFNWLLFLSNFLLPFTFCYLKSVTFPPHFRIICKCLKCRVLFSRQLGDYEVRNSKWKYCWQTSNRACLHVNSPDTLFWSILFCQRFLGQSTREASCLPAIWSINTILI